jgi:uncharacterized circularly permuted ATP-grasp superfamily protein
MLTLMLMYSGHCRTALVASVSAPMPGSAAAVAAAQDAGSSSSSSSGEAVDVWVLDMAYRYDTTS